MVERPVSQRLRVLAFDPSLTMRLETAALNELTVEVPWDDKLEAGPIGEYVEVVNADPASGVFLSPRQSEGSVSAGAGRAGAVGIEPAVPSADGLRGGDDDDPALRTFAGRVALWANHRIRTEGQYREQFVRRLRIYPHALRDRNAYYSPSKKALLFGYFPVTSKDVNNTPGTVVFTCLSHDIVAHEVTHALLDGVHPRFNEPSNPDVHAFHEAFADIVALFQHFSYPTVLESQIRRTRGDLHTESLLGQLAQQFGQATGRGTALRDALGA